MSAKGSKYQRATSYKNHTQTCGTLKSKYLERRKTLDKRNKNSEI